MTRKLKAKDSGCVALPRAWPLAIVQWWGHQRPSASRGAERAEPVTPRARRPVTKPLSQAPHPLSLPPRVLSGLWRCPPRLFLCSAREALPLPLHPSLLFLPSVGFLIIFLLLSLFLPDLLLQPASPFLLEGPQSLSSWSEQCVAAVGLAGLLGGSPGRVLLGVLLCRITRPLHLPGRARVLPSGPSAEPLRNQDVQNQERCTREQGQTLSRRHWGLS